MDVKCAEEGFKRQAENPMLEQKCVPELMEGLANEESATKLVQNDFAAMKEEIRQIQLESGSTVCSEASTSVGKVCQRYFRETTARRCCSF